MWHYLYVVWLHLGISRLAPVIAAVILLDAVTGLSQRLSQMLDMKRRGDLVLLVLTIVATAALWWEFEVLYGTYLEDHFLVMTDNPSAVARDAVWQALADRYRPFIEILVLASVIGGPFLAHYKGRSFAQWTALSLLGNVGAIVWLLLAPRKNVGESVAGATP